MKTPAKEFLDAHKKVRRGKRILSDRDFIKYKSKKQDNLNSLGKFFSDKRISSVELEKIADQFNKKNYILMPYTCVVLPKGTDSYRPILVPSPRDRILFSYILEKIKGNFLAEINKYKIFGSGKRTDYQNIKKIIEGVQLESKKHKFILKLDICKFFPSIDQTILFKKMDGYIKDPYVLKLIKESFNNEITIKYTKNFSEEKKKEIANTIKSGVPQGCAYSPLLANFYGIDLDFYCHKNNLVSFRYLDDMIIFLESEDHAKKVFEEIKLIAKDLKLEIHEIDKKIKNKTYVQQSNHTFEYLGIEIKSDGTFSIPLSKVKKEISLIKTGIFNKITIKKFGAEKVIDVLNSQLNGWKRYYISNFPTAYIDMPNKKIYNEDLKNYYRSVIRNRGQSLRDELALAGFDLNDHKFYL